MATATASIARAIAGHGARVTCTRKTMPGLRAVQKYAVRVGGGSNHRYGLDDAVLIKDNHIALAGGIEAAVARARAGVGHMVKIELEVDTLEPVSYTHLDVYKRQTPGRSRPRRWRGSGCA